MQEVRPNIFHMLQPPYQILKTTGWIWNGHLRLEGELILYPDSLIFNLKDLSENQLKFSIQLAEIESVKCFLLFGIEKNGLHLTTKNQTDKYFILENAVEVKQKIAYQLPKYHA